ncbi:MAG: ferrous iron transport protein A [Chlorobi bacterium]|nr:ferrous iron transport protein A [Chlorobiota bacterium]
MRTSLDKAEKGNSVKITGLPEGETAAQLIRLGITVGRTVKCLDRLPGGTVILQNRRQEIAIGQRLAENISVVI